MRSSRTGGTYSIRTNNRRVTGGFVRLQVPATCSANLITDGDTTKALRVTMNGCTGGSWTPATGVCGGTSSTLLGPIPPSGLASVQSLPAGSVQRLQVSVQLPDQSETTVNGTLPAVTVQRAEREPEHDLRRDPALGHHHRA